MRLCVAILLLCAGLHGQAQQPPTFHVHGTIVDVTGAVIVGVTVVFEREHSTTTLSTSNFGVYDADLPSANTP
jgi:hypothetical protein